MFLKDCSNLKSIKRYSDLKKIVCLVLVLLNMLVYLPVSTYAANTDINVGSAEGKVGDIVEVPISFSKLPRNGITYFSFDLEFDTKNLQYIGNVIHLQNKDGSSVTNGFKIYIYDKASNIIRFEYNINENVNDSIKTEEKIATIRFKILSDSKPSLSLTIQSEYYNPSNGTITVTKASSPVSTPTNTFSNTPTNTATNTPAPQYSQGLWAVYYNDESGGYFKEPVYEGSVKTIRFDWGDSPFNEKVPKDHFSIRWQGFIEPLYSEEYTFYAKSDDGVKIIIDGNTILDGWSIHDNRTEFTSSTVELVAGKKHNITVEYFENTGLASIQVSWSSKNQKKEIIPEKQLFYIAPSNVTPTVTPTFTVTPTPTKTTPTSTSTPTPTKATATMTATATATKSGTPTPTATPAPYIPPASSSTVLQPIPTVPQTIPSDLSLALSSDKTTYDANQNIVFDIHYRNRLATEVSNIKLSSDIPPNTTFVESTGGVVAGNKITWDLGTLKGNEEGTVKYTVKVESFEGADKEVVINANITSTNSKDNTDDDNKSMLKILLYAKKAALGSHKKYINGYPDNTFRPEKPITRAEISSIISRVLNLDASSDKQIFTDVGKNHWAIKEINAATKSGFFKGATATQFKPDSFITKGELAAVLCRCLGMEESSIDGTDFFFSDTKDNWAGMYVEELYRSKIVVGSGGKFYPKNQIKRAEAITMINRMLFRGPLTGKTLEFTDVPATHWGYGHIAEAVFDHKYSKDPNGGEKYEDGK
jgi:hypothetical protein